MNFTRQHLKPYRGRMVVYGIFVVLSVVFTMATALSVADFLKLLFGTDDAGMAVATQQGNMLSEALQWIYDRLIVYGPQRALLCFSLLVFVMYAFKNVFTYLASIQINVVRSYVVRDIRNALYYSSLRLPLSYFTSHKQGDVLSRFSNDVVEYDENILASIQQLLFSVISMLLYLLMLFYISPLLSLVVLLALPVVAFVISGISRKLKQKSKAIQEHGALLMSTIEETISGLKVVKSFNAIDFMNHRFQESNALYSRLRTRMFRRIYLASPVSDTMGNAIVIVILLFGSMLILNGKGGLTPELFISYLMMFVLMIPPAKELSTAISTMKKGQACAERISEYLDEHESEEYQKGDDKAESEFVDGDVEFRDVCFSYGGGNEVLHHVSFTIPKGQTVALVGSSGSGKSTIADLLTLFYQPTSGQILLGGKPLSDIPVGLYRKHLGVVTQEPLLFNHTVSQNIAFRAQSAHDIDMDRVRRAAQIANADEFIGQLCDGYDTMIGDGGSLLSGGQQQRIAIARALYDDPGIIILDEATSALDSQSEHEVQRALNSALQQRTALVIAHRLSTIRNADRILVLENGQIVEQGTHHDLMRQNGRYSYLVSLQRLQEEQIDEGYRLDDSGKKTPSLGTKILSFLMPLLMMLSSVSLWAQDVADTVINLTVDNPHTGYVGLSWNSVEGANQYEVYQRMGDNQPYTCIQTVNGTQYGYLLSHSVCQQSVCHYIKCEVGGSIKVSRPYCDQFYEADPTAEVTNLLASVVGYPQQSIQLQWTPSVDTDIMGYFLCSGEPCMELDTLWDASLTQYQVDAFPVDEVHTFRMYAFDSCGIASPLTVSVRNMVLQLELDDCESTATLHWSSYQNMPAGLDRYLVQRSVDGLNFIDAETVLPDMTTAHVSVPANATQVLYRICAEGQNGHRAYSNVVSYSLSTADTAAYLNLCSVSVTDDETAIIVRAAVDPDYVPQDGYNLYRSIANEQYALVAHLPYRADGLLHYVDHSVNPTQVLCTYRLGCLDGCGRNEKFSNAATAVMPSADQSTLGIELQWNPIGYWNGTPDYHVLRRSESSSAWTDLTTCSMPLFSDPVTDFSEPVHYRIQCFGINAMGEADSAQSSSVQLSQESFVWIPNAFTPTLDVNNVICPYASFLSPADYSFAIYDRMGTLLFYTEDPSQCWDGRYQGFLMPTGSYVYVLKYNQALGKPQIKKGNILLIQ